VIFLLGITMMFSADYSSVLILYFWEGVIIWLMLTNKNECTFLRDYYTDE